MKAGKRKTMSCSYGICFIIFYFLFSYSSMAQLRISLKLEHQAVLQFEQLNAFVFIQNDMLTSFVLDEGMNENKVHFRFIVEREPNEFVSGADAAPLVSKLEIMPGEKTELAFDVSKSYDIRTLGRYFIRAVVDLGNGRNLCSDKQMIDVVRGLEIQSITRSTPWDTKQKRRYSLCYWGRDNSESLFLRVDDEATGMNYGVFDLGRVVRVKNPVIDVDRQGNVTVTHQTGNNCFIKSVFMSLPKSVTFIDQTYHLPDGSPYPSAGSPVESGVSGGAESGVKK